MIRSIKKHFFKISLFKIWYNITFLLVTISLVFCVILLDLKMFGLLY